MEIKYNREYKTYSINVIRDSPTYGMGLSNAKLWDVILWLIDNDWMVNL